MKWKPKLFPFSFTVRNLKAIFIFRQDNDFWKSVSFSIWCVLIYSLSWGSGCMVRLSQQPWHRATPLWQALRQLNNCGNRWATVARSSFLVPRAQAYLVCRGITAPWLKLFLCSTHTHIYTLIHLLPAFSTKKGKHEMHSAVGKQFCQGLWQGRGSRVLADPGKTARAGPANKAATCSFRLLVA